MQVAGCGEGGRGKGEVWGRNAHGHGHGHGWGYVIGEGYLVAISEAHWGDWSGMRDMGVVSWGDCNAIYLGRVSTYDIIHYYQTMGNIDT